MPRSATAQDETETLTDDQDRHDPRANRLSQVRARGQRRPRGLPRGRPPPASLDVGDDRVRALPIARCQERGIRSRVATASQTRKHARRAGEMVAGQWDQLSKRWKTTRLRSSPVPDE